MTDVELYNENECSQKKKGNLIFHKSSSSDSIKCTCKMNHLLFKYPKFKELHSTDRKPFLKKNKLFDNCLSAKHYDFQCNSAFSCIIANPVCTRINLRITHHLLFARISNQKNILIQTSF